MITLIAALSKNNAIGYKNNLLYHLPNDMKRFKKLTTGNTVIMGRKTFESFPHGALPNRRNIVITHSDIVFENTEICHSLNDALELAKNDNIFIIGGGQIYNEALKYADILELTIIDDIPENADTFFPEWKNNENWGIIYTEAHNKDEKHAYNYTFETWKKDK